MDNRIFKQVLHNDGFCTRQRDGETVWTRDHLAANGIATITLREVDAETWAVSLDFNGRNVTRNRDRDQALQDIAIILKH